jgi:predicted alpha/beta-hydrolase family hydrolase
VATTISTEAGEISVVLDGPERFDPLLLLAHGAGGGMHNAFMDTMAAGLAAREVDVLRFNFAYSERGKKSPDRGPILEQTYRDVVEHVRSELSPGRLFVGGKSMGGRIASQVVAGGLDVDGLVFLGYPLHPPGRPERLRADHLVDIEVPMLFVEGTRDPFCPLETLEAVREGLKAPTKVAVIHDGDHSLKVRKSSGRSTPEAWAEAVEAIVEWSDKHRIGA